MARRTPDAIDSLRVLAVVILGVVGLSTALSFFHRSLWAMVAGVEGPFLLGPLAYALAFRLGVVDSFALRLPRFRSVFFVLLASAGSMWLLNGLVLLQELLLTKIGMGEYVRSAGDRLERQVMDVLLSDRIAAVALFSAIPALCEEFFFRGIVFQGFQRSFSPFRALLYTAVLFALVHLEPLKMLPMLALGFFFGGLVLLTRSLWSSVLAHAANNLAVLFVSLAGHDRGTDVARAGPWYAYAASAAVFALAMACLIADHRAESREG